MTNPGDSDPLRYAADALAESGIPVVVDEEPGAGQDPKALVDQFIQTLASGAPAGWVKLHGAISMAGGEEIAQAVAENPDGSVRIPVTSNALEPIRLHRQITAGSAGPWLRLLFECDNSGTLRIGFDYGDNGLPADQLLSSEAYARDVRQYPRADMPLWLLAHLGNEGQQMRSAADAHHRASVGVGEVATADDEIPALSLLWPRIAALAAVCRGSGAPVGPRTDPSFQAHVGDSGGCILARLPGDRAVLSGGRDDSRLLMAAYRGEIPWPDLYRGAPVWLHNLYLDPRAASGMLSFCYWWHAGHWYRAELTEAAPLLQADPPWVATEEIVRGVPGVWSVNSTASLITRVLGRIGVEFTDHNANSPARLVRAAEAGICSAHHLSDLFANGMPQAFDMAEALSQLDAADVLLPAIPALDQATATALVHDYCRDHGFTARGYPVEQLRAARIDGGWDLYVPVAPGEIPIDATVFLVADDGVVEPTTMHDPEKMFFDFASRFANRIRRQR
ncbi:hypothetical protein [Mycobacterium vicinigordonae]|uniref:Uncharacterized protein n=1 Tax=Mycobacterium vicinigordonae TaxID=1719132 RepID=A0A7D6DWV5_9MYCO|nr:hypothetical protein [Mycobacterium vicinigordonae]QLL06009.1 hypothetical protein H0P51_19790 [Mycobacterium vicinigordonae]